MPFTDFRLSRITIIFLFALLIIPSIGKSQSEGKQPYNELQEIRSDLKTAIQRAMTEKKHILVQFGGNWCPWCLRFHALVEGTPRLDSLMKADYIYLLANVPRDKAKRDYKLFEEYGYPNRFGFPVFVILDKSGTRLNTQDSDAFEHPGPGVKGYDTAKVERFLKMWTPAALDASNYPVR
jgi:thioredoxin-related protein